MKSAPTELFEDNLGCIALTKNAKFHGRTKHIDIKVHYVRELVNRGEIVFSYCQSELQLADILTKPMPKGRLMFLRDQLCVRI